MSEKKVINDIRQYIENNQPKFYWNYNDKLSDEEILSVIEKGILEFENDIYENAFEYIFELENDLLNRIIKIYKKELLEFTNEKNIQLYVDEKFRQHICVDMNVDELLNQCNKLTCLIPLYSNYDCCNSLDNPLTTDKETYLGQVFNRVKAGVKRSDYTNEFYNGAYGGCLFMFAFRTDLLNLMKLKEEIKTKKYIKIPKGTQFGFFSSFQGCGSIFEKTTYRNMKILIKENDYDCIDIIADLEQSYSIKYVYGDSDFIDNQIINVI